MTVELSVAISFVLFAAIFAWKVYPLFVRQLDDHIDMVKKKISDAEALQVEAQKALERAKQRETEISGLVEANRAKSEEKIRKLQEENERLLRALRERHEISLKNQLEAEFVKERNNLIDRLSDLIIEKVSKQVEDKGYRFTVSLEKKDLEKLLLKNHII